MKRDLRVCLNNRGFPSFLFNGLLMQCIESILNQLMEQILILAASLTFRGHEAGLFLAY